MIKKIKNIISAKYPLYPIYGAKWITGRGKVNNTKNVQKET